MKNASRTMYTIGKVINIIAIVLYAVFVILFAVALNDNEVIARYAQEQGKTIQETKDIITFGLVFFIVELIITIAAVIIAFNATKSLKREDGRIAPHIVMLVVGVVGFEIFYILGGIFGLVANANRNQQPQQ